MKLRSVFQHVQVNAGIKSIRMNLFLNLIFSLVPFIFIAPIIVTLAAGFLALISLTVNILGKRILSPFNYIFGLGLAFVLRYSLSHGMFSGEFFAVVFAFLTLSKSMNLRNYGDGVIFLILILGCNATILLMDTDESLSILIWCLVGILWAIGNLLRINLKDFSSPILIASLKSAAVATLYTLPLLIFLFFIFAKFSHSPLYTPYHEDTFIGLSRNLEPGRVSDLKSDNSIAFRVKMSRNEFALNDMYWRGPVLTQSQGMSWHMSNKKLTEFPFTFMSESGGCLVKQSFYIQRANLEGIRFALDTPIYSSFQAGSPYTISSDVCNRTLKYQAPDREALEPYLQVDSSITKKTKALALKFKSESHSEDEFRRSVFRYFKENKFQYTISSLKSTSLEDFLFHTKSGYCENYAGAFATLARIAGIPSRIVTGFANGKYNSYGGYWVVSYSDAHAWVELWEKSKGWVRVDPTTIVAHIDLKTTAPFFEFEKVSLAIDAFLFWLRGLFNHRGTLFSIDLINPNPLQLSLLIVVLLCWLMIRKARLDYKIEVVKEFKRLSNILNERTIPRSRSEGLETYRLRVVDWIRNHNNTRELAEPLNRIFEEFVSWKYSSHTQTQYELRLLVKMMATVRRSIFVKTHFLNVTRTSK